MSEERKRKFSKNFNEWAAFELCDGSYADFCECLKDLEGDEPNE